MRNEQEIGRIQMRWDKARSAAGASVSAQPHIFLRALAGFHGSIRTLEIVAILDHTDSPVEYTYWLLREGEAIPKLAAIGADTYRGVIIVEQVPYYLFGVSLCLVISRNFSWTSFGAS